MELRSIGATRDARRMRSSYAMIPRDHRPALEFEWSSGRRASIVDSCLAFCVYSLLSSCRCCPLSRPPSPCKSVPSRSGRATASCRAIGSRSATASRSTSRKTPCGVSRGLNAAIGTSTRFRNIIAGTASGTISAVPDSTAAATTAAALARAGRARRSVRSGIAGNEALTAPRVIASQRVRA
nr:hypothetical protein BDOA9_0157430 [Bradyrhizobium sp. DOA9]